MSMAKKWSATQVLREARENGWRIVPQSGAVLFQPPAGLTEQEAVRQQERIAEAAAEVAQRHVGYCYEGCA